MTRYMFLLVCSLLATYQLFSQKYDYNWYERNKQSGASNGVFAQFNEQSNNLEIDTFFWNGRVIGSPSFSDESGNFLFFSNGAHIYDTVGEIALHGDSIAVGYYQNLILEEFPEDFGTPVFQNAACIPINDSLFYWFHNTQEVWIGSPFWAIDIEEDGIMLQAYADELFLTKMKKNNQEKVEIIPSEKEISILKDTLAMDQLSFVKHANGMDWWMIIPEHYNDSAYLFRIDVPSGEVELKGKTYMSDQNDRASVSRFNRSSPDGNILARFINVSGNETDSGNQLQHKLELFHFDRCNGQMDRFLLDSFPVAEVWSFSGDIAFSDNGRFLYLAISQYILQMDLETDFPMENIDTIGEWDGFRYQNRAPTFGHIWEVPNGKLLVAGLSNTPFMHYIHNPNEKGSACNFEQRAIELPLDPYNPPFNTTIVSLPTYPPYRMPPLDYPCEVSNNEALIQSVFVSLYPNPTIDQVAIQIQGARIKNSFIFDLMGNQLKGSTNGQFYVHDLARGLYLVKIETDKGSFIRKLVVE